jgi:Flp pilus assembly protein TadB
MALQGAGKRSLWGRCIEKPRLAAVLVVLGTLVPGVLAVISMVVAIKVTVIWLGAAASRHCKRNDAQQEAALEDIFFAGHECSESVEVCFISWLKLG